MIDCFVVLSLQVRDMEQEWQQFPKTLSFQIEFRHAVSDINVVLLLLPTAALRRSATPLGVNACGPGRPLILGTFRLGYGECYGQTYLRVN